MIERWLQITCDNEDCGDVDNSTAPNMTIGEFLAEITPPWVKVGRKHYCSRQCADYCKETGRARRSDVTASVANLGLTSCDFVGDSGCSDPGCERCHGGHP